MSKVVVVTDSSANIPPELARQLDIRVVPLLLAVNGRTFHDGVDLMPGELYRRLRTEKSLPTTSAPSVGDFLRVYASAEQEASGIVSIHVSPKLSVTYSIALTASQLLDGTPIRVIDSHSGAMAEGFVVLEAARMAAAGAGFDEVVARAEEIAPKVNLLAMIDNLQYLHQGGRIGGAASLLATVLQIKPVVYLADGHVEVFAKPRTQAKAVRVMLDQMAREVDGRPVHVAIMHADALDEAESMREQVVARFQVAEFYVTEFTPVMGTHAGPGLLGIVYYVK
jgi:fatty acid kinase fatty acid binding subunit